MITSLSLGRLGRMGNAMFTVAGCIGIARRSGQPFAFPKLILHDMVERFGQTEDNHLYKYLANPLPELPDGLQYREYGYFWEYRDIYLPTGNWSIDAHMQSERFFEHCIDEVRHYFTFKDERAPREAIAIHVRMGDYINDPKAYHPVCSIDYYKQAISRFPSGSKFIVFSDDITRANEMLKDVLSAHGMNAIYWSSNYIEDFKLMKSCAHFITANSSYSHFAALMGEHPEKKIIMPSRWFGEQAGGLTFDGLYPKNAIVI